MQTRYFIELILFIFMAIFFQYEIGNYVKIHEEAYKEYAALIAMK
jgi:hypothetical protein